MSGPSKLFSSHFRPLVGHDAGVLGVLTLGTFLTFAQFAYVAILNLPSQVTIADGYPRLKPRVVPIRRWMVQVVLFLGVSLSEWAPET